MRQRQQHRTDCSGKRIARSLQPQRHRHLDLHTSFTAPAIADILRIGGREWVPSQPRVVPELGDGLPYRGLQRLIEATHKRLLRMTIASVNRDHMIAAGQQLQASRLIKPVARQMERGIVASTPDSLEQVEVEVHSGNSTRKFRRVLLDKASMRCYHSDGRTCSRTHVNSVIRAFDLGFGEIAESHVTVRGVAHKSGRLGDCNARFLKSAGEQCRPKFRERVGGHSNPQEIPGARSGDIANTTEFGVRTSQQR